MNAQRGGGGNGGGTGVRKLHTVDKSLPDNVAALGMLTIVIGRVSHRLKKKVGFHEISCKS